MKSYIFLLICIVLFTSSAFVQKKSKRQKSQEKGERVTVAVEAKIHAQTNTFTMRVKIVGSKQWKTILNEKLKDIPTYKGSIAIGPFSKKNHDRLFAKKERKPVDEGALIVILHQMQLLDEKAKKYQVYEFVWVIDLNGKVFREKTEEYEKIIPAQEKLKPKPWKRNAEESAIV